MVDRIETQAGTWMAKSLSFGMGNLEQYLLYHRDPVCAIQSLWGNPVLSKHLVYCPMRVYMSEERNIGIYNEMWTGNWWHLVQVSYAINTSFG